MKIVLYKTLIRDEFKKDANRKYFLGFGYIKAYLQQKFPKVEVKVCYEPEDIFKEKPGIIGISSVTEVWEVTKNIIKKLRKGFDGYIVIGGHHISALPQLLPEDADIGVIGEGEETFSEIVEHITKSGKVDFGNIRGIAYHKNNKILLTLPRPLLDMDTLPLPADYPKEMCHLSTVRGCPFHCSHCVEWRLYKKPRQLSAKRLTDLMISHYESTGNVEFYFLDDLFLAFPKRVFEIHSILKDKGLLNKFRIHKVSLCAHLTTEEILKAAKEIEVVNMGIGLESASPRILEKFKNGVVTVEHIENAIKIADRLGMYIGASTVFGFPGETEEDIRLTIDFIRRYEKTTTFRFWQPYVCQPLPGSTLWSRGLENKSLSLNMDFSTLRIDADTTHFKSKWFYANHNVVPRQRFIKILSNNDLIHPGYFVKPKWYNVIKNRMKHYAKKILPKSVIEKLKR